MKRLTQLRSIAEAEKALLIGKLNAAMAVMDACGFDPDSDGAFEACVRGAVEARGRLGDQRSAADRALKAEASLQTILPSSEGADRTTALTRLRNKLDWQLEEVDRDLAKLRDACPHEDTALHGTCRTCGVTLL